MSSPRTPRFGRRRVGATAASCPTPFRIHMHVDANRDGVVDDDWTRNNNWSGGSRRLGAIILCNCDDEDGKTRSDNQNDVVDTATDKPDIAPLFLRRRPVRCAVPSGWRMVIEVSAFHKDCIRIFDKWGAGGREIVGPTAGRSHEITDLSPTEWQFGMEATQFPGRMKRAGTPSGVGPFGDNWDGFVTLTLSLLDGAGAVQYTETARVRAAPWLIFTHHDPTDKVFVTDSSDNADFRSDLTTAAGVPVRTFSNDDRWMQDVMEPGFTTLPQPTGTADPHLPAVLRTAVNRTSRGGLDALLGRELLRPNQGFYSALNPGGGSSLDSFGNLECVPPFTHPRTRRDYKFGRIVYGRGGAEDMREEVRELLDAQKVQFPFTVDTSWLIVGHVDEVMSFLPMDSAPKKFKVLLASPRRAVEILNALLPTDPGALFFQGIRPAPGSPWPGLPPGTPSVPSVANILADAAFLRVQTEAQTKIDDMRRRLADEVGLRPDEFIELPILFRAEGPQMVAFTAGSVNMLVVTSGARTRSGARTAKLCIPKPFGPVVGGVCQFQADMERVLAPTGATYTFIDDFETYHNGYGEIHCGTNSQRKAPLDRFWWHQTRI